MKRCSPGPTFSARSGRGDSGCRLQAGQAADLPLPGTRPTRRSAVSHLSLALLCVLTPLSVIPQNWHLSWHRKPHPPDNSRGVVHVNSKVKSSTAVRMAALFVIAGNDKLLYCFLKCNCIYNNNNTWFNI